MEDIEGDVFFEGGVRGGGGVESFLRHLRIRSYNYFYQTLKRNSKVYKFGVKFLK